MIVMFWVIAGIIVAMIAGSKGRNWLLWLVYGVLIWPIALVHSLLLKPNSATSRAAEIAAGMRACPDCAEMIRPEATICRFCRSSVEPALAPIPADLPAHKLQALRQTGRIPD